MQWEPLLGEALGLLRVLTMLLREGDGGKGLIETDLE